MELIKLKATVLDSTGYVLKDCPFCGGKAQLRGTTRKQGLLTYLIQCQICGASSDFFHRVHLAVQMWNKRK